jgi:hypothetical protein
MPTAIVCTNYRINLILLKLFFLNQWQARVRVGAGVEEIT